MTVKKWVPCALWDITGLQSWLNEQAAAGYALADWPGWSFMGRVSFQEDPEAVHTRYCLDPIGERIGEVELQDRRESYEEAGWHYAGKIGKLYAIYRCDDPTAPELYSDPQSLAWAMKKQMRWMWAALLICLLWPVALFWDEWPLLFHYPAEFLMELMLRAEILIHLYGIMLVMVVLVVSDGISTFRGIRRARACLSRGQWPPAGPHRYREGCRFLMSAAIGGLFVVFLFYLGLSGTMHTKKLSSVEEWTFPHAALEEILPAGSSFRAYGPKELLHSDTFDHSLLVPEQYDVAQGGITAASDGSLLETRLDQEYLRSSSPSLARMVYRGRVAAHRHSLEEYRKNWEENTLLLHSSLPNAYDFLLEEELSYPGLDSLTRFSYRFSDSPSPNTVFIGLCGDQVFVLNGSGAADTDAALELLVERLQAEYAERRLP